MKNEQTAIIIKNLCKLKGVSISNLLLECDIRKSLIYDMEKRDCAPSAEILEKIADFLDCSVDYLLGRTDIMEINKVSEYSQSVLNAAHSGDEVNIKSLTAKQEADIDKLIEKRNNNE